MSVAIDIVTISSRGLERSAEMIRRVLATRFPTRISIPRKENGYLLHRRLWMHCEDRLTRPTRIMLFLQILPAEWMRLTGFPILIPNQEFVSDETVRNLPDCPQVWCKTRYADDLFRQRGHATRFIGFTSKDAYVPDRVKDYNKFIHVAGTSFRKGTFKITALWRKHPEWPLLQIVTRGAAHTYYGAPNLLFHRDDMPESELHALMNECGIHLCPSEAEGFGHHISEALSTGALVISTDGPPMNEIVRPEFGLLARPNHSEAMGFGERFNVGADELERQIENALQLSAAERVRMGKAAREAYLERDAAFPPRLLAAVNELLAM